MHTSFGESKVFLEPAVGERFQPVLLAVPSLRVEVLTARVTSLSFPSLRKVGDLYSKRLDSPRGAVV